MPPGQPPGVFIALFYLLVTNTTNYMKPTIGRIVHLTLTAEMSEQINRRRTSTSSIKKRTEEDRWPIGAQAHIGNETKEGTVVPMIITEVWSDTCINGKAILDGTDSYWVTFANQGDQPGNWFWPPRD